MHLLKRAAIGILWAFMLWVGLIVLYPFLPYSVAAIIQAVIPQVVPTANKRGTATVFQLATNTSSATAGTPFCDDGSGNATTSGCTGGGTVPAGSSIFNSTSSATATAASATSLIGGGAATIPANALITQDPLSTFFGGIYTIPGAYAGTLTIQLLIAGSSVASSGTITLPAAAVTNGAWRLSCQITVRTAGVSGTAIYSCPLEMIGSSLTSLTPAEASLSNTGTFSINTTISNTIDIQATWSTTLGSPSITGQYATGFIGGAPVTSVGGQTGAVAGEGNGTKVQMFTGSDPGTGNFAKYDSNHNVIDGLFIVGMGQLATTVTTSGSQSSVTFSGISGSFSLLQFDYCAIDNVVGSTEGMSITFNADATAGDYTSTQFIIGNTTTVSGGNAGVQFVNNLPGSTATANVPGCGTVTIPGYAGTTFFKRFFHHGGYAQSGVNDLVIDTTGTWKSTAAVTSIKFSVATSFKDGSTFTASFKP